MEKQLRLSLLSLLVMLCGNAFAANDTITFSELGYENSKQLSKVEGVYVTLTFSTGDGTTAPAYYDDGNAARLYGSNTLTVTASTAITEITFEYSGTTNVPDDSLQTFSVNQGTYDYDSCKWTGDTTELVITNSGSTQWRIQVMTITLGDGAKKNAHLAFSEDDIKVELGVDEFTSPTFTYATDATITFSSDNEAVATVDTEGVITLAGGVGTAVISAVCDSTETYLADSTACVITTAEKVQETLTATETITFSELNYNNSEQVSEVEGSYVTLTFSNGTGSTKPKYYNTGTAVRLYGGNTLTITSDYTIIEVNFTYATDSLPDSDGGDISVSSGSYDCSSNTWTGSTSELVITHTSPTGHWRIQSIEITVTNCSFYIMGPAVGTWDDSTTDYSSAWDDSDDNSHALRLTYDDDEQCYKYLDADNAETTIHFNAGQPFCFVCDRDFTNSIYMEDDVTPVDLSGTDTSDWSYGSESTNNEESNVYGLADNDDVNGNHDTQYINFLKHSSGTDTTTYNADVSTITFNLPSGDYNIRLYNKSLNGESKYYYIISPRDITFYYKLAFDTGVLLDDNGNECRSVKAYSDYHAIVLPDNMYAWTVGEYTSVEETATETTSEETTTETSSGTATGTIVITKLEWDADADRIIPANTPVILGFVPGDDVETPTSTEQGTAITVSDIEYCATPWTTIDDVDLTSDAATAVNNSTYVAATERTQVPDNAYMLGTYLFSSTADDGTTTSDSKLTRGFFRVHGTTSINSAYITIDNSDDEDESSQTRFISVVLALDDDTDALDDNDENETTGIDTITTTDDNSGDGYYYSLQGMRLTQKPTTKGIYIHNGKKIIVR